MKDLSLAGTRVFQHLQGGQLMQAYAPNTAAGEGLSQFRVARDPCTWMKAGRINFRTCDRRYDCFNCPFDSAMKAAMAAQHPPKGKERTPGWAQAMRRHYLGADKPCRYLLNGQIGPPGICRRDYECEGCPIDMFFEYGSAFGAIVKSTQNRRSGGHAEESAKN